MAPVPIDTGPVRYVPALDGLRGLAVCAVIGFHAFWLKGGWAGVDVFFVLSGYLITTNLKREADRDGRIGFGRFFMRRILRLTPALWALLAAVALIAPFRRQPDHTFHALALSVTYLMNWSRAFAWFPDDLLDHTWSLAMEEQFYLVWPLAYALLRNGRPALWLTAALVATTVWRVILCWSGADTLRTYCGFDTHADGLILGCLLALAPPGPRLAAVARRFAGIPLLGLAAIFAALPIDLVWSQAIGLSVAALLSAWLVVAATVPGLLADLLSVRPLVFLGKISYGLYLWHFPIFVLLLSKLPPLARPGLILVSIGLATVSYFAIERPFLRLKTAFEPGARRAPVREVELTSPQQIRLRAPRRRAAP